jgi:DNA-binding winged helix-turn-helix (wHTH) protein
MTKSFASGGRAFRLSGDGRLEAVRREEVPLSARQARLLAFLLGNPLRQVSEAELLQAVWDGQKPADGTVAAAIRALSVALGDDPEAPLFVETLSQRGWRFLVEPEGAAPAAAEPPASEAAALARTLKAPSTDPKSPSYIGPALLRARELGKAKDLSDDYFRALNALIETMERSGADRRAQLPVLALETVVEALQAA